MIQLSNYYSEDWIIKLYIIFLIILYDLIILILLDILYDLMM